MKILIANSAYSDLETIKAYYEEKSVLHVGKEFLKTIIEHIQTLAGNPDIGRVVPEFEEERIRELIHSPFRIVYLMEHDSIHVIRVWRSERFIRLPENEKHQT